MSKESTSLWIYIIACVLFFGGAFLWKRYECSSKWERSGRPWSWGPVAGCQIQRPDKTWVPAETYREVAP